MLPVDTFHRTAAQNPFLDVMLKYRFRIPFPICCRYENDADLKAEEKIDTDRNGHNRTEPPAMTIFTACVHYAV